MIAPNFYISSFSPEVAGLRSSEFEEVVFRIFVCVFVIVSFSLPNIHSLSLSLSPPHKWSDEGARCEEYDKSYGGVGVTKLKFHFCLSLLLLLLPLNRPPCRYNAIRYLDRQFDGRLEVRQFYLLTSDSK